MLPRAVTHQLLLALVAITALRTANAHGWIMQPASRNLMAEGEDNFYQQMSLNRWVPSIHCACACSGCHHTSIKCRACCNIASCMNVSFYGGRTAEPLPGPVLCHCIMRKECVTNRPSDNSRCFTYCVIDSLQNMFIPIFAGLAARRTGSVAACILVTRASRWAASLPSAPLQQTGPKAAPWRSPSRYGPTT